MEAAFDRYVLGERLGAGGYGTVYRARHSILETEVALKVLSPQHAGRSDMVQRFLREAKTAAAIGSAHIVRVIDAGVADGVPFIAMELLEGEDLESRIARRGALAIDDAIAITLQVLDGLGAAHARGIVHRDMKPANVFLTPRAGAPFVKILDFGISKIIEPDAQRLTAAGTMMGTASYMAPEQIVNARGADARADLYSVAVILFESITGRLPYPADTLSDLMMRATGAEPSSVHRYLPSAPAALEALLAKGLASDPAHRFQSAAAMAEALERARGAEAVAGGSSTGPMVPSPLIGLPPSTPAAGAQMPSTRAAPLSPPAMVAYGPMAPPPSTHAPRRSSGATWIVVGVLAALLPIACIGGGLLFWESAPDEPTPTPPVAPVTPPPAPALPPLVPPIVPSPPLRPGLPDAPAPLDAPLVAAAIPEGASPCAVPVVQDVTSDRAVDRFERSPCEARRDRELFVIAAYAAASGGAIDVDVARTAAPVVLVLGAYSETEWRVRVAPGVRIERAITTGYATTSRVTGLPAEVPIEHRRAGWPPMGWQWDTGGAGWSGRLLAEAAERETGLLLRAYVGSYSMRRVLLAQRAM